MNNTKTEPNKLSIRITFYHFVIAGILTAIAEMIHASFRGFPLFGNLTEKILFILIIIGFVALFSAVFFVIWKIAETIFRFLIRKVLGITLSSWKFFPHHQVVILVWVFILIDNWLIKTFIEKFHNQDMISFSLTAIQAFVLLISMLIISALTLKHNKEQDSVQATSTGKYSEKILSYIFNPYFLSAIFFGILFYLNRGWISTVIDIDFLFKITLLIFFAYLVSFLVEKRGFPFLRIRAIKVGLQLSILFVFLFGIFNINYSQNLQVCLHRHVSIPHYTLKFISKIIPLNSLPSLFKAPIEKGDFNLSSYLKSNIQEFDYDKRAIKKILGDTSDWNIIILTIDSIRPDHMSFFGYPFPTTPNMDKMAEEGVIFEKNFIQGGDSPNSVNSIVSGILPWHFKRRQSKLLKDILREEGFTTAFVGYSALFKREPFCTNYDDLVMLDKKYDLIWRTTTSEELVAEIIKLTDKYKDNDQRFFLHSQLLDAHAGYIRNPETHRFKGSKLMTFDGEIAHTDKYVGVLIDHLKDIGLWENTLLILTCDHGEEHLDHGDRWHGKHLYNESCNIPVIANFPGLSGRRIKIPTGSVDIVPTILSFLNIKADPPRQGTDLLPLLYHGDTSDIKPVFSYIPNGTYRKYGIIYGPWKLIYTRSQKTFELYNLDIDWAERLNLVDRYTNLTVSLRTKLVEHFGNKDPIPEIFQTDPELEGSRKSESKKKKLPDTKKTKPFDIKPDTVLNEPRDVSFGPDGNYAVADFRNYRIAVFDAKGKLKNQFGEKGARPGQFSDPCGIDFSDDGYIYVADTFNQRVQKFSKEGKLIWIASYRFNYPRALVAVSDGVWVSNYGKHQLVKINREGKFVKTIGSRGSGQGQFIKPVGVAVDKNGNLFVADKGNKRIQVFSETGEFIRSIAVDGWQEHMFNFPYLCFDHLGQLYATDPPNNRILVFEPKTGTLISQYPPETSEKRSPFQNPMGIDYEPSLKQFAVADCRHNRVVSIHIKKIARSSHP